MAKRFTDTAKWDKAWFRKLPAEYKCVWMFLCDRCDHAGVWDIDEDAFAYFIGDEILLADVVQKFGDKVQVLGDKLVISDFADFQYGSLNPDNRVHKSVLDRLEKLTLKKGLKRSIQGPKDTDTDKDKDTETDKDKDRAKFLFEFWNANRGPLPEAEKLTDERRQKAKAQWRKYPNEEHWHKVLERWSNSEFCVGKWRPNFDDFLKESKRTATLEGRYDDRDAPGKSSMTDAEYAAREAAIFGEGA